VAQALLPVLHFELASIIMGGLAAVAPWSGGLP